MSHNPPRLPPPPLFLNPGFFPFVAAAAKMAGSSGSCDAHIPQFETAELNTRVFHVGSFGALWRKALPEDETSLQKAVLVDEDAAVAQEFHCTPEVASELRALCR